MDFAELTEAVCSIIQENDPYKKSKRLQLKNWCSTFFKLFKEADRNRLPFFLDVLSDEDCWERSDSINRIELNRRIVAKMLVRLRSWKGRKNPLGVFEHFQVASWCCLEKDIFLAFEQCKRIDNVKCGDSAKLKELVKILSTSSIWGDRLTEYWAHIVSGYVSELKLKGNHMYEYGLYIAVHKLDKKAKKSEDDEVELGKKNYRGYVEAVEFFWNKIESLPEDELKLHQKNEIFVTTAMRAAVTDCVNNPEIFEFCFTQLDPELCPEFMKRASLEHNFSAISRVQSCRSDLIPKIFNCLYPLVLFNCLRPVWTVLEDATADELAIFMNTDHASNIHDLLKDREDKYSFVRFLSFFARKLILESMDTY